MICAKCGKPLSIDFKEVRADTLYKEYKCPEGHKTTYLRYGTVVEINGAKVARCEFFTPVVNPEKLRRFRRDGKTQTYRQP